MVIFMEPNFNYKTAYLFLLSLFGLIIVGSLFKLVNNTSAANYSIFGLICCLFVWIIDQQIIYSAEKITHTGVYYSRIDDSKIHKILGGRQVLLWVLIVILLIVFLFSFVFILSPASW